MQICLRPLTFAAASAAEERGPAPELLHPRVQGGAANLQRQLQGGSPTHHISRTAARE